MIIGINKVRKLLKIALTQFLQISITFLIMGSVLFFAAGRLQWMEAWIFLLVYFLIAFISSIWLLLNDPELLQERSQAITKTNVMIWDRIIQVLNLLLTLALFGMVGLDAGRLHLSTIPLVLRIFGGIIILFAFGLTLWASSVNTFMSSLVRIQKEREHRAITMGPYKYIRHPMYVGMCLLYIGIPLLLNSWWSLIVSALLMLVLIFRTFKEDTILQKELSGYSEYARKVKYRLFPGIW